jgi:hypothetical protein
MLHAFFLKQNQVKVQDSASVRTWYVGLHCFVYMNLFISQYAIKYVFS